VVITVVTTREPMFAASARFFAISGGISIATIVIAAKDHKKPWPAYYVASAFCVLAWLAFLGALATLAVATSLEPLFHFLGALVFSPVLYHLLPKTIRASGEN
jgi:hypothetical protein